jgi:DNA-binding NarL/FixJ family response regulator
MITNDINEIERCRILFLEDSKGDIELMKRELDRNRFSYSSVWVSARNEFLSALKEFKPDIILADYSLPMFNGMHAFRLFKEARINIPFILVTGSLSEQLAMDCVSEGVDDFILKSDFRRLPFLITRNIEIKRSETERIRIATELAKKNAELKDIRETVEREKTHEMLSNREYEILCMIGSGVSVKEIADRLNISPATVATYRARILEKLNLKSNVDITRFAIHNGLIE